MIRGAFQQVYAFHHFCGLPVGETPQKLAPQRSAERARMLNEEVYEVIEADAFHGVEDSVAERLDAIYFLLGDIVEMGVDPEPIWQEICRANMAKAGGWINEHGKLTKPKGWTPPSFDGLVKPICHGELCRRCGADYDGGRSCPMGCRP